MKANQSAKRNDEAEVGIGTMIVFIATILVAAIAASVLINTSMKLQDKSTATGNDATDAVGTSLEVVHLYGAVHTAANDIDYLDIWVQLASGSEPVDLTEVVLQVKTGSAVKSYNFEGGASGDNFLVGEDTDPVTGGVQAEAAYAGGLDEEFVIYTSGGTTKATAAQRVLEPGELLMLRLGATSASIGTALDLAEDTKGTVTLLPERGLVTSVSFTTPETYSSDLVFELA